MLQFFYRSISRQIVGGISLAMTITLVIVSYFVIGQVNTNARAQLESSISNIVRNQSVAIEGFFVAKGQSIHSIFASPPLLNWFKNYDSRGASLAKDQGYQDLVKYFSHFSDQDSAIKSIFFGSENTHEYFDLDGRYDGDEYYYTNKRPWWQEAINHNKLYVSDPAVDANDGDISATIKRAIYLDNGQFIGVGGMDILISTIGEELLDKIKYQGEGQAFLMTQQGKLVFFPKFSDQFPPSSQLSEVDTQFSHAADFTRLQRQMMNSDQGFTKVTWQGQPYLVAFNRVSSDYPYMRWSLGFMVPEHLITEPVNQIILELVAITIFMIVFIAIIVWFLTRPLIARIKRLHNAIRDIAQGDGDLTKRITILRHDEIGALVDGFNQFLEKMHQLVSRTVEISQSVHSSSNEAGLLSEQTQKIIEQQQKEVERVASASVELAQTSHIMAQNATETELSSQGAHQKVTDGSIIVENAVTVINHLSNEIDTAAQVVAKLRQDSQSIGEVLSVIKSIADQTNLLALNAAIEAARAGEQGRGFAVVADEVRTLANRTQESTNSIQVIIEELQTSANTAESVMSSSCKEAKEAVELTYKVQHTLQEVANEIVQIQQQTKHMATSINQQAAVSDDVSANIERVSELAKETVIDSEKMSLRVNSLVANSSELKRAMSLFKI
ncbi:MAG: methyl-accepting chemotaxis protein [Psychrobium sp.]|nr:methyl-accepting chemotaxis protein [Psychrobium sp.]